MRRISSSVFLRRRYLSRPLADRVKTWFISYLRRAAFVICSMRVINCVCMEIEITLSNRCDRWYYYRSPPLHRIYYLFTLTHLYHLCHLSSLNISLFIKENAGIQLIYFIISSQFRKRYFQRYLRLHSKD